MMSDKEAEDIGRQAGGLLRWMKLNLAVIAFVSTTLTAIGSALVAGVMRTSEVMHEIDALEDGQRDAKSRLSQLHTDMVDVDRRLNNGASSVTDTQRQCEMRSAALEQRIAVLEAQLQFFAGRLPPVQVGPERRK
jgi:septal ring factor EnvC (AmiA/AmiB activator)